MDINLNINEKTLKKTSIKKTNLGKKTKIQSC
jgi:hypothetical protein